MVDGRVRGVIVTVTFRRVMLAWLSGISVHNHVSSGPKSMWPLHEDRLSKIYPCMRATFELSVRRI